MTCEQIERDEIAEQYLFGRLSGADQDRFEAHYFDCTRCQERLRALEDARVQLARDVADGLGQSTSRPAAAVRRSGLVWRVVGAGLAAAAVIVFAVRITQIPDTNSPTGADAAPSGGGDVTLPNAPSTPAAPDLRALAQIQPPRYEPLRLRAATTQAQREFRDAMELYVAGDYAGAAVGLHRAVELDTSLVAANFYLAVCVLQSDQTEEGVTLLQRVIASGESPYLEDAHFFLAKASIRQGDIAAARSELTHVAALDGDRRTEARQLLARLP
jgi:TolA-binding protein